MTFANEVVNGIGFIIISIMFLIVFFAFLTKERMLDRYRLKYSFDRELESKDISGDNKEEKLNRRERLFKRRTFKD